MKTGTKVLCRKKGTEAYEKRFIVDYLPSTRMVSFGDSKFSNAVYYHDINGWDIVIMEESK